MMVDDRDWDVLKECMIMQNKFLKPTIRRYAPHGSLGCYRNLSELK